MFWGDYTQFVNSKAQRRRHIASPLSRQASDIREAIRQKPVPKLILPLINRRPEIGDQSIGLLPIAGVRYWWAWAPERVILLSWNLLTLFLTFSPKNFLIQDPKKYEGSARQYAPTPAY